MKLWGGRFFEEPDERAFSFNASITFDKRLYREDIEGSLAHADMLAKQGIISREDGQSIRDELLAIRDELDQGLLEVDESCEDIHSFIEQELTKRIGDAGKRLHTGRSRNDQVALDMKLYVRHATKDLDQKLYSLLAVLCSFMEEHKDTIMPGFTHMQKAQPVTLAHHLDAYFEMFRRDRERLSDITKHEYLCPLGAGALAGTTYPLDRDYTAKLLGFDGPTRNSMDSVSDRDYLIELLSDLSVIMMHLSRFCEEIVQWNSDEYHFVEISDSFSTGSSIMPQKKNPDYAELIRGKTGRVYGSLMSLLTTMKSLPLAYDKDMQEDKEPVFDAVDTVSDCLIIFTDMLKSLHFHKDVMAKSAEKGFINATDAADYLAARGVPFRDAHSIAGRLVLRCIDEGKSLNELSLSEFREESDVFGPDIYDAIDISNCLSRRETKGAPGPAAMENTIACCRRYLSETKEGV